MIKQKNGFTFIEVLVVVVIISVVIGAFYIERITSNNLNTISPTPTIPLNQLTFKDVMNQCIEDQTGYRKTRIDTIPLRVDKNALNEIISVTMLNDLVCYGKTGNGWINGDMGDGFSLTIYNGDSDEGGHGGVGFLRPIGTEITQGNSTEIYNYFPMPDVGPSYVDSISIRIRGIKKITLFNGEEMYIQIDRETIPAGNPRLIELLNQYSKIYADDGTFKEGVVLNLDYNNIDESMSLISGKIKQTFFANIDNLQEPEATVYSNILTILNSVSGK